MIYYMCAVFSPMETTYIQKHMYNEQLHLSEIKPALIYTSKKQCKW